MSAPSFFSGNDVGGTMSPGAIVGNRDVPWGAFFLAQNESVTSDDLQPGDAGDFGGLSAWAVEFWFQPSTLPGGNEVIIGGPESQDVGWPEWFMYLFSTGQLQAITRRDSNHDNTVLTSAVISVGSWHHVVMGLDGSNARLIVDGVSASTSMGGDITSPMLGSGTNQNIDIFGSTSVASNWRYDELAMYRSWPGDARFAEHYRAGRNLGFAASSVHARINDVLDKASNHAPRSIRVGQHDIEPRYMSGQAPLEEVRICADVEGGPAAFLTRADGTLTFLDSLWNVTSPWNTFQDTIGDAGLESGETPYETLSPFSVSDLGIVNRWNVTRSDNTYQAPVTQTAEDTASISAYGLREQSLSDVPLYGAPPSNADADAADIAGFLLDRTKDPQAAETTAEFNLLLPDVAQRFLRRELLDRIRVKRRPPPSGSTVMDEQLHIQAIEISGANDGAPWRGTWTLDDA